jgi:hypothetical protein
MNRTMRLMFAAAACGGMWPADGLRAWSADPPATGSAPGQAELMAARGRIRYRGEWRTAQEIELIERHERETAAPSCLGCQAAAAAAGTRPLAGRR